MRIYRDNNLNKKTYKNNMWLKLVGIKLGESLSIDLITTSTKFIFLFFHSPLHFPIPHLTMMKISRVYLTSFLALYLNFEMLF